MRPVAALLASMGAARLCASLSEAVTLIAKRTTRKRHPIVTALLITMAFAACEDEGTPAPTATEAPPSSEPTSPAEPAAETLAFIRDGDIWLVEADGGNERRITEYAGTDSEVVSFTWLADGEKIAYQAAMRVGPATPTPLTAANVLADADGTVLWERELPHSYGALSAVWSPSGEMVAVRDEGALSIEGLDGRAVWTGNLQEAPGGSYQSFAGLVWSNDSARLAYADNEEIVVVHLSSDPPAEQRAAISFPSCPEGEKCSVGRAVFGGPAFARDGTSVVVPVAQEGEIGAVGNAQFVLYKIGLVAATPTSTQFFPPGADADKEVSRLPDLVFSPDGLYISYGTFVHGSACEAASGVTVLTADAGRIERFVPDEIAAAQGGFAPRGADTSRGPGIYSSGSGWSPASDAIAAGFQMIDCSLAGAPGGSVEDVTIAEGLYVFHPGGSSQEKLSEDLPSSAPAWSRSGTLIAYDVGGPDASTIRVLDISTRRTVDIGSGKSPAWRPAE